MHPELFKIGSITIYSYGVMVAIGFLVSVFLAQQEALRKNWDKNLIVDAAFVLIISGLIGARLLFVILNLDYFSQHPLEIILINRGGLVWYGGLLVSIFSLWVFTRIRKQDFLSFLDFLAPYACIGQAFGRLGCFFRGCCYGKPTDSWLGIYFPIYDQVIYPTQLLSVLKLVIIFVILRLLSKKVSFRGGIFFTYLMLYSLGRFLIEFLRGDSDFLFLGLTPFQLMSIPLFLISLSFFYYARAKFQRV